MVYTEEEEEEEEEEDGENRGLADFRIAIPLAMVSSYFVSVFRQRNTRGSQ